MDKLGGPVTQLASAQSARAPDAIATDGSFVFWTNLKGTTLNSTSVLGGPVNVVATVANNCRRLALDGTHVYWTTFADEEGAVSRSTKQPASATDLLATSKYPWGIAADDDAVYWKEPSRLMKQELSGGEPTVVSSTSEGGMDIAADATAIYIYGSGKIVSVPKTGGEPVTLATGVDTSDPEGIAVDDANVSWVELSTGKDNGVPKAGGPVTVIAAGQPGPRRVVADEAAIYWTNSGVDPNHGTGGPRGA